MSKEITDEELKSYYEDLIADNYFMSPEYYEQNLD